MKIRDKIREWLGISALEKKVDKQEAGNHECIMSLMEGSSEHRAQEALLSQRIYKVEEKVKNLERQAKEPIVETGREPFKANVLVDIHDIFRKLTIEERNSFINVFIDYSSTEILEKELNKRKEKKN